MCKIYPGIEFEPIEDGTTQKPKVNFFDMDPSLRWELLRRGMEDQIPSWTKIQKIASQKILDGKDPVGGEE